MYLKLVYRRYNMNNLQDIGKENWSIVILFVIISMFIMTLLPDKGLEWISFVAIALIIGLFNSFALSSKSDNFSKNSKKFLLFRIGWSLTFSFYVIFTEMKIFPDFGLYIVILFYFLAIFDILLNIFSRQIATEVGPGFMPKKII